jgi:hypothetical protein
MSNVWKISATATEPSTTLRNWMVFEAELEPGVVTQHLAGDLCQHSEGRVTSALVFVDAEARTARTKSGRLYKLVGEPGLGSQAEYVMDAWLRINDAKLVGDVTAAVFPKCEA